MKDLTCFTLGNVMKRLNKINININLKYSKPFPKKKEQLLSWYEYKNRFVEITPQGYFSLPKLICSLINFSFIRSLIADCYSKEGGNAYDPVSLFLMQLFCYLDKFRTIADFCNILQDKENGNAYRAYAGISINYIPSTATLSNFKTHIGEAKFNAIFHILVNIAKQLDLITGNILSHDGTLVPTYARYKGCNYACNDCKDILIGDFITKTRTRILKLLENPAQVKPGKEMRAYAKCPRANTMPKDVKPPSIHVIAFSLVPFDQDYASNDQTAKLFGLEDELKKHNLMIKPIRSNISKINLDLQTNPVYVNCPRCPADLTAKIGYRRNKINPDKKEKVFGFNVMISTSIEPITGIELPVACITIPNSEHESEHFIDLKFQINSRHQFDTNIDIGDAGYDAESNYTFCRNEGSIPIFDYNPRNEDLSQETLYLRGYNQNGSPYAPCKAICKPNGYDKQAKRLSFACMKQCLSTPSSYVPNTIPNCPYLQSSLGFSTHMSIKNHPRLISEIPRCSIRWQKIRNLRPASERTNSSMKDNDLYILSKPKTRGLVKFSTLAQLASILLLLKRIADFIVFITVTLCKFLLSHDKKIWKLLQLHKLPNYLSGFIQLE